MILSTGIPGTCIAGLDNNTITVVFRYDDYSSRSTTTIERRIMDSFARFHMTCTFGVLPFVCAGSAQDIEPQEVVPLSAAKIAMLKDVIDSGSAELALHGYSHQTIRKKTVGLKATEFYGLDYNSQLS